MKPTSERLQRYRSRNSRSELRRDLFYLHVVLALLAVGLIVNACLRLPAPAAWTSLGGGAVLVLVQVGLLRCLAWSRFAAAGLLAAASLALTARIVLGYDGWTAAWHVAIFAALAAYLAHPQAGELFRDARRSFED
jgi:hypothetical protein